MLAQIGGILVPSLAHPLNAGCVAWWVSLAHRSGGARYVDVIGSNHGTLTSGPLWRGSFRPGGLGVSLLFNTGYVVTPKLFNLTGTAFTLSGWLKITGGVVASNLGVGFGGWEISNGDNVTNLGLWNGAAWVGSNSAFTGNVWTHFAICHAAGGPTRFYKDGLPDGSSAHANPIASNGSNGNLSLGVRPIGGGSGILAGSMDDFRIQTVDLGDAGVQALYECSRRGYPGVLNRVSPVLYSIPAAGGGGGTTLFRRTLYNRTGSRGVAA